MTKTEQLILDEIQAKGYFVVQYGHNTTSVLGRIGSWGTRQSNAALKLKDAGVVKVTGHGCDRDAHQGRACISYWTKYELV